MIQKVKAPERTREEEIAEAEQQLLKAEAEQASLAQNVDRQVATIAELRQRLIELRSRRTQDITVRSRSSAPARSRTSAPAGAEAPIATVFITRPK